MLLIWTACLLAALAWAVMGLAGLARAQTAPQQAAVAAVSAAGVVNGELIIIGTAGGDFLHVARAGAALVV
jgi:hypothetical protein